MADWAEAAKEMARWRVMCLAPKDGTFIRLRSRVTLLAPRGVDTVGQWKEHDDGFKGWFDRAGNYITPYPIEWAPEHGGFC